MDTLIGKTLAHYCILGQIGAGGVGEVYRAHDERLNRDVALKVLSSGILADETARKRFRNEAFALSKLNHPNIATVFDFDTQEGMDFLVMEYVAGETLGERLHAGPLTEKEVARLGVELAEGLAGAHGRGVIHRDLKPGNVRLTPDGRLKILDFGLAKLVHRTGGIEEAVTQAATATEGGAAVGTLPYMAPEQLRGERADERTDLWAAGLVLYELATGRRAFSETDNARLIVAILQDEVPLPSRMNRRVSPGLDSIIAKCLEKDPEGRYQSAKELAVDLRRLGSPARTTAVPPARSLGRLRVAGTIAGLMTALFTVLFATNVGGVRRLLLGAGSATPIHSLAVLPLDNFSRDPGQEYFVDGMTDELTTTLAQLGALKVISRTSSMRYKGTKKSLPEIGRELGVDAVIEGSVMRVGNRVRITAQLVRASTDQHLWAQSYERDLPEVLALQSDVAQSIAREIGARLRPETMARLGARRPVDPTVYEAWLRGRHYLRSVDEASGRKAIAQFQDAIRIDSTYAPAWAGLADGWFYLSTEYAPAREAMPKVRAAAARALDLDPGLAEAHATLGAAQAFYDWEWEAGERSLRRAIELNPNSPTAHYYLTSVLEARGRLDDALAEARTAAELDPLSESMARAPIIVQYLAGHYETAIAGWQEVIEKNPTGPYAHGSLAGCYVEQHRYAAAVAELKKLSVLPGAEPWVFAYLCRAYGAWGKPTLARDAFEEFAKRSHASLTSASLFAVAYMGLGDQDRAFEWLNRAYDERDQGLLYLNVSPGWSPLRSDPRFQDLLRRMMLVK